MNIYLLLLNRIEQQDVELPPAKIINSILDVYNECVQKTNVNSMSKTDVFF